MSAIKPFFFVSAGPRRKRRHTRITGRSRRSVINYMTAYKKAGLKGLTPGKAPGQSKYLTDDQEKALEKVIAEQFPSDVGFENRANWTLALAAQYVEREWGISYSLKGMSIVLKRLGLSFTHPTYPLEKANPEKQRQFKEDTFPALKKLIFGEVDHLLFVDESMIRDYQASNASFRRRDNTGTPN